ncbi:cell division cycle and apoptosis regulator protein 1-like, partial [Centroberyx affinis]|uniref:cell division cycle and apoptosis regulator protein 1-like n=1 Tax=Centroberyx affinis TaxID=166261 RepID=UPI003A5C6BB5
EEERKRLEELERQRRERRYILPDEPTILVHPNWAAKNGKFDCSVMSLSVLLDYRLEDNKEHSFEVSLFAELFNEMLQRDFGYRIYKALAAIPAKDEKKEKEKKAKKEAEKKEAEKREVKKEKEEDNEEPVVKKAKEEDEKKKDDEKVLKKEESRDEDENEDEGSTANAEEYDPMEAEDADDDDDDDKDDDDSNDRERKDDRKDGRKSSKERSSKDKEKEKKQMVTYNKELLMAFVYFDQSHCGYLMERDLEEIMYTLGLHLSRAQVKKLLNKPVVRESCYYRKLTDRGKDEPAPSFNGAQLDNLLGNRGLLPAPKARAQSEASESGNLIVYNGAMVDIGSMMQKLDKTEKAREEIEQKLIVQDAKMDDDAKAMGQLEQANKTLSRELEEVKNTLSQTEDSLKTTQEQKSSFHDQLHKTSNTLSATVKELLAVLKKDQESEQPADKVTGDQTRTSQTNGADE